MSATHVLHPQDTFVHRHIGPTNADITAMLRVLQVASLDALVDETIPQGIRLDRALVLDSIPSDRELGEHELVARLHGIADKNKVFRSYIGMGYYDCITPAVILRNILENPGWYTQYTPYQAEIAQGRLEALLNFQTMVADLTGLPMANASLLDESTAAAEAMGMCHALDQKGRRVFYVADDCHPQTIAVVQTRAEALGLEVNVGPVAPLPWNDTIFGVLVQYPATDGRVVDYSALCKEAHGREARVVVATDLLALTLLRSPGEFGADIAVGSAQRFGVPMGYGGPHAGFLATSDAYKRQLPGRVIGVSKDARGKKAYRMAMQTREQHIRREKATSNICTAQALFAIMAGMYAVYHGPEGVRRIGERVHLLTKVLAAGLTKLGFDCGKHAVFDTLRIACGKRGSADVINAAQGSGINLRPLDAQTVTISLDETTCLQDLEALWTVFDPVKGAQLLGTEVAATVTATIPEPHRRTSTYLTHAVFNSYHCEHEMLRYINRLRQRDLSLTHSMIALGSCTMKLNATSEMIPVTWPTFGRLHPFAPVEQAGGYQELFSTLSHWLAEITGFAAVSLQPNAGAQGEYAGLMVVRRYHQSRGQSARNVCLIPVSAHGTNPASAAMAGLKVVPVACDAAGNIDVNDLRAKAEQHRDKLAAVMVTYPSTHGVFEASIREICNVVHEHGGQVYLDGANMNAQVGLCRPGDYGADVGHLNLHKTFCIPHGGGGPGMGPIGVAKHLAPFLPGHPVVHTGGAEGIGPIAAAPWGSASILPISWAYIAMMGAAGLKKATQVAILNANYMVARLKDHYPVLYTGKNHRVAHEFILDMRPFKASAGIEAEDVAKRLMDYGFHAPTMSFPVAGTLMVEPTESESRAELDRFCEAMISIRQEIKAVETGKMDRQNNALKHAPHTAEVVTATEWNHPYTREQAAFPAPWLRDNKFWPAVGRIDNAYGDRNLICTCPPMDTYQ